ncbi:ImuA family protein [Sagittula salina]|uniref:Protein ImuA n=1 Tax=Sagittula salina TaxID=2820268 RepID=A0A940MPX0_9RHOB|nr:hypothetical protein [Sagittula salina]MBP0482558.1 hypothetical protein [Sagittula salina]
MTRIALENKRRTFYCPRMKDNPLPTRAPHRSPPRIVLDQGMPDELAFRLSRVHELCGSARRTLALQIAARIGGPLVWIAPEHTTEQLCAQALLQLGPGYKPAAGADPQLDPGRLLFVTPSRRTDLLWAMEEALKDGAALLVVAELDAPPGMTPVRRLHLAAEAGTAAGTTPPLGLILTPGDGGAPGIETRWRCTPCHAPERPGWRLDRLRARMMPPRSWHWNGARAETFPDCADTPARQAPRTPRPLPTTSAPASSPATTVRGIQFP